MKPIICVTLALASVTSGANAADAMPAPPAMPSPAAHQSVLEGYRRYEAPPAIAWRDANDQAAALGGHLGQVRGRAATPPRDRHMPKQDQRGGRR